MASSDPPSILHDPFSTLALRTDIVVIGAGQGGALRSIPPQAARLAPNRGFLALDGGTAPGGAWQHRWPSLTFGTVNRIHDLPGMRFAKVIEPGACTRRRASPSPPTSPLTSGASSCPSIPHGGARRLSALRDASGHKARQYLLFSVIGST